MKTSTAFVTTLVVLASFPVLAQQPPAATQPNDPASQQTPSSTAPAGLPNGSAGSTAEMSPVNSELVSKLDTKTAKAGDDIVVQTKESIKTADGTSIPTGSKLVGHIVGVKASQAGTNSQVALQFDHVELQGGKNLPVRSQIQSIAPASGASAASASTGMAGSSAGNASSSSSAPQSAGNNPGGAETGKPAAGVVVAQNGNINISTTSVPGVLLANNAPGQQDPRMAQTSSILLGAKQDVQLASGTQMVVAVAVPNGGAR